MRELPSWGHCLHRVLLLGLQLLLDGSVHLAGLLLLLEESGRCRLGAVARVVELGAGVRGLGVPLGGLEDLVGLVLVGEEDLGGVDLELGGALLLVGRLVLDVALVGW